MAIHSLVQELIMVKGFNEEEAEQAVEEMRDRVEDGEAPDGVLEDEGLDVHGAWINTLNCED